MGAEYHGWEVRKHLAAILMILVPSMVAALGWAVHHRVDGNVSLTVVFLTFLSGGFAIGRAIGYVEFIYVNESGALGADDIGDGEFKSGGEGPS